MDNPATLIRDRLVKTGASGAEFDWLDRVAGEKNDLVAALRACAGVLEAFGETESTCDPLAAAYAAIDKATTT